MAVNKVVYDGNTLIDITSTTATADKILAGFGCFGADGTWIDGTATSGGGSGYAYETGTYTPSEDASRLTIDFSSTHSEAPILAACVDQSSASGASSNSIVLWVYFDPYKLFGAGFPYSTSALRYAVNYYSYRGSGSSITQSGYVCQYNSSNTSSSSVSYPRYWATESAIYPYSNSTSRYFRSGRTYKWVAVFKD